MSGSPPVFVSYSRKDYYFAESLAFELLKVGIPAWLDVKDLAPGEFWQSDLEKALDQASFVIVVASPESMQSVHVRAEIDRAIGAGKTILVACFRRATLLAQLQGCETFDFRFSFNRALRVLAARISGTEQSNRQRSQPGLFPILPPSVYAVTAILAIPTITFLMIGNWGEPGAGLSYVALRAAEFASAADWSGGRVSLSCIAAWA